MTRQFLSVLTLSLLISTPADSEDTHPSAGAVEDTLELSELILNHHVLPPTRQEMLLSALRSAFRESGTPLPLDVSRRFSNAASTEELRSMMIDRLDAIVAQDRISEDALGEALREGLFAVVPGHVGVIAAENERVNAQFRSNRYVGTGIALSVDNGVPIMHQVIPGGPADSVDALDGDRIEAIQGESTNGMSLKRVVELLRGPEGTDVTVSLRQPGENQPRVVTITRGVVPFETITGYELFSAGDNGVVAYLRIERLSASCVHELQTCSEKLKRDGVHGLVLDLRFTTPGEIHHAVLLADALLDGTEIGRVRTLDGDRNYVAEPGELFPDLKLGILVARTSRGTVEWLAAALQDAGRALILGELTPGAAFASEAIPTAREDQVLILPTALLERAGGRNLLRPVAGERSRNSPEAIVRSEMHISPQTAPWGVQPDVPLPARTSQELAGMPAAAAHRLLNPPRSARARSWLRRNNSPPERSPSDD
jgi:carboxyl-terminal processing protease